MSNAVEPIRDKTKIEAMKKVLRSGSLRDYLLFVLGINTGLRVSDLLNLQYQDILDHKNRIVDILTVVEIKTGKTRKFPLNKAARKALEEFLESRKGYNTCDYIFASQKSKLRPMSRVHAWYLLNQAARTIGIADRIGTHTLRKTFGYHAYKQGYDITLLQQVFNHASPKITLRYIGITQDDIDEVYINLNL